MTIEAQHSITPPQELVGEWLCSEDYPWGPLEQQSITITTNRLQNVANQAARWGADQELEACCSEVSWNGNCKALAAELRRRRRPNPPSLKSQALAALARLKSGALCADCVTDESTIRRALEALPE